MDVGSTVAKLAELGVRVHCLALGGVELTSSTGKLTMNVINAVAEFERERWRGLRTAARTVGPVLGRSPRQNARGRRHRRCYLGAAPNLNSLNQGAAPMLSWRCRGSSTKRARLLRPSTSGSSAVGSGILMLWLHGF